MTEIFDTWPQKYDQWFETPIGRLVGKYERRLVLDMVRPERGESILDVGCGTGIFTFDILSAGSRVVGVDLSFPMLRRAGEKAAGYPFCPVRGDMRMLPFPDNCFDKTVSVTAIEFLEDAGGSVAELFRVTRPGGIVAVATLNSLSPWAVRRTAAAKQGHAIFEHARFRSPAQLADLAPFPADIRTAVHFRKNDDPDRAAGMEKDGNARGLNTGAFLIARWNKPAA